MLHSDIDHIHRFDCIIIILCNFQLTFSHPAELQLKILVLDLIMNNVDTISKREKREMANLFDLRITDLTFLLLLLQSLYKSALSSEEREIAILSQYFSKYETKILLTLSFSISVLAACLALPIAQPK